MAPVLGPALGPVEEVVVVLAPPARADFGGGDGGVAAHEGYEHERRGGAHGAIVARVVTSFEGEPDDTGRGDGRSVDDRVSLHGSGRSSPSMAEGSMCMGRV
jgi:hypothetical protein